MIYLYNLLPLSIERSRVNAIHYQPFDAIYGFGKTQAELGQDGILVDVLPEIDPSQIGSVPVIYCNPTTKAVWYEYEERPLTSDEEVAKLKDQQVLMQQAIDDLILGGAL